MPQVNNPSATPWGAIFAGLSASLVGIGLARFAYTPLLPALIEGQWFQASDAAYLGAANLAGYLGGALAARPLAARLPAAAILRAAMALTALAFVACASPLSFLWFFGWRFVSGVTGGLLMALAAPTVLPHVPAARRGLASGAIFTGVGLGVAASGTIVPPLLQEGLAWTWYGLGAVSAVLTLLAWRAWPSALPDATPSASRPSGGIVLKVFYGEYALNAVGIVPHMVFLVDFVARGLGQGIHVGASYWVIFGGGALIGSLLAGFVADRIGFRAAMRGAYLLQAAAVALPIFATGPWALVLSSVVIGAFVPGVVALALGRVQELLPGDPSAQRAAWGLTTVAWAVGQASSAYFFSYLYGQTGGYGFLFAIGSGALVLAFVLDLIWGRRS